MVQGHRTGAGYALTELEALELKLIVRDTIMAPALDSLFLSARVQDGRVYPFDPNTFTKVTGERSSPSC